MKYFYQDTIKFLKELSKNNNKDWFAENKNRFKNDVKSPFKNFIADLIIKLQPYIPNLNIEAKDCIFRINKDVRFSKDKTPYKNHVSAMISTGGRYDKTTPGLYFELSGEEFRIYSGCFNLTTNQIEKIRSHIHNNLSKFDALINDTDFKNTFGEIKGEKYKRIPVKYQDSIEIQPLLLNKTFSFYKKYETDLALKSELLETILNDYNKCLDINKFLLEALEN
ncbi:DUF2461 domain-containing protein [Mariniflexile sp. HMF6888]|uniref:DUF2461 domain-containing protein n=1 Tax=Mariniflexile sp. HMF6888 TaxID=3373086 RepID=UPI0037B4199B